jgi:hypothetical protein
MAAGSASVRPHLACVGADVSGFRRCITRHRSAVCFGDRRCRGVRSADESVGVVVGQSVMTVVASPWHPWAATDLPARPSARGGPKWAGGELPWSTTHRHGAAGPKSSFGPAFRLKTSITGYVGECPAVVRCNRSNRPRSRAPAMNSRRFIRSPRRPRRAGSAEW